MNHTCQLCRYFAKDTQAARAVLAQAEENQMYGHRPDHVYGECRCHAPVIQAGFSSHSRWPVVYHDDWCGEWVSVTA